MATTKKRNRSRTSRELRQEQILDEATRIIGQRGYYGFGIQELAQCCRLTNAGLLYHFGSKEQLLISLLQYRDRCDAVAIAPVAGLAGQAKARRTLPLDTVFKLLRAMVERNTTQPEIIRLYAVLRAEALNPPHPAHDYFLTREATTLDVFAKLVAPHVPHPGSTARQLLALMLGLEDQWLRADRSFDLVAEWDRGVAKLLPSPR